MEEFVKSRDNDEHQEEQGSWNRPVRGLVLEESHFKDRLVDRFNVNGMEQLDQTRLQSHSQSICMDFGFESTVLDEYGPAITPRTSMVRKTHLDKKNSSNSAIKSWIYVTRFLWVMTPGSAGSTRAMAGRVSVTQI